MPVEGGSGVGDGFVDPDATSRSEVGNRPGMVRATDGRPEAGKPGVGNRDSVDLEHGLDEDSLEAKVLRENLLAEGGFLDDDKDQESRIVTARGTEHGLVLRIDGKSEWAVIRAELEHFLGGRKKFFEGGEVSIEWIDRLPAPEQAKELGDELRAEYGLTVVTRRRRFAVEGRSSAESRVGNRKELPANQKGSTISLFQDSDLKGDMTRPEGRSESPRGEISRAELLARTEFGRALRERNAADGGISIGGNLTEQRSREGSGRGSAKMDTGERSREAVFAELGMEGLEEFGLGDYRRPEGDSGRYSGRISDSSRLSSGEYEKDSGLSSARRVASQMARMLGGPDLFYEDEANAKILFGTLRSGQRVETPFSLVVIGDVNPGADLVAGGDIIVLGSLKGTAHASAYDDDSFDRVIIALQMQPMQLRIGSVLSRGSEEVVRGAEIARIENRRIIVEAYNPRMMWGKKLR